MVFVFQTADCMYVMHEKCKTTKAYIMPYLTGLKKIVFHTSCSVLSVPQSTDKNVVC